MSNNDLLRALGYLGANAMEPSIFNQLGQSHHLILLV